jgi:hypothetical protein
MDSSFFLGTPCINEYKKKRLFVVENLLINFENMYYKSTYYNFAAIKNLVWGAASYC